MTKVGIKKKKKDPLQLCEIKEKFGGRNKI